MADKWDKLAARANKASNGAVSKTVLYTPDGLSQFSLKCGYWSTYYESDPGTGAQIQIQEPLLSLTISDLPAYPSNRDTVKIDGVDYHVRGIEPDKSVGNAKLTLKEFN